MRIVRAVIAFRSADGDELPEFLYHGTSLEIWEQHISKEGLDPDKTDDRGKGTETKGYIFLALKAKQAREWVPGGPYNNGPGAGAILRIRLDAQLAGKIRTALGEFIRCPVRILPNRIELVGTTKPKPLSRRRR